MGVYRAAFTSIEQTEPLSGIRPGRKIKVPVVALGGENGLGDRVIAMVKMVASDVVGEVIPDCGHFVPEERPEEIIRHIKALTSRITLA
jgi:pimeloyl-ACP methyl ester carboxylesterase